MLHSSMGDDYQLTLAPVFAHGRRVHARSRVITYTGDGYVDATFAQVAERADRLAAALAALDVRPGDRVGTFLWNNQTGEVLPWDGVSLGEIEVRGPWVACSYYEVDDVDRFDDGWLRTGDVACVSPDGFVQISDRSKDVIKSGGEWVSSVDLENLLMGHPGVAEAAVIAVPDERWDERPLACVVMRAGADVDAAELRSWLSERTAKFWVPEYWAFIDEVPKTSVGKFDKKVLRARREAGDLTIEQAG